MRKRQIYHIPLLTAYEFCSEGVIAVSGEGFNQKDLAPLFAGDDELFEEQDDSF